ncbi:HEAT repeat domain-containing protein [Croceimicrobium hydrocarbonivorans]|uniref:HEAT repeat domain-containing protein n=1 Tax=Croceimicrobium hydrocarbonivorans TaxID=2761580 RepID=A0A7H0VFP9_9FLAO|nr:HEAT repeat domain-containing protein [Croceimicrobium hydrocarbonivorans]QNR24547.1 HEAT repeat domain-containing protein [Croceimicrobium hydrocarbonivorans]
MKRLTILLAIILQTLSAFQVKADSWKDPEWKEMIDNSDVIALVEYISEGDFRAKARPLSIYKGKLSTDEIWISGFSNRYGPIDKMSPGDKYIVFLNFYEATERALEYWQEQIIEDPNLTEYYEALRTGKAFYVWTATSGDLRVKGETVQYDLLQTSYYDNQKYYSFAEFEAFLKSTRQTENSNFHEEILNKLRSKASEEISAQYLMMLHLTSFKSYDPVFQRIANEEQSKPCYALAQILGQVKSEKSRDILLQLLDNENSLVQGEVVRQLSNEDPEFIGPILLAHLDSAGLGGVYPSNLMDPVRNRIDGAKIEIIRTLGEIKYKPAAESLLPLLDTEEDYLFELLIDVLIQLDNKDFIPYINKHLKKRTKSLIIEICGIITNNDLEECKPALMEFISNHNRNDDPSYEYAISTYMGLAHFDDQETRDFLLKDFENLLNNNDTIDSHKRMVWIRAYIETFKNLKSEEARPLIYRSLFNWFGYNYDFALHPELFAIKKSLEDSINQKALNILEGHGVAEIQSLVFINNTSDYGESFNPSFDQIILIKLEPSKMNLYGYNEIWNKLKKVKEILSEELNIPIEHIGSRSGAYVSNLDARLNVDIDWSPMQKFYEYAIELASKTDLLFLKTLAQSGFAKDDFDKRQLNKTITKIEGKLEKDG